jgi:hypothetical protein
MRIDKDPLYLNVAGMVPVATNDYSSVFMKAVVRMVTATFTNNTKVQVAGGTVSISLPQICKESICQMASCHFNTRCKGPSTDLLQSPACVWCMRCMWERQH